MTKILTKQLVMQKAKTDVMENIKSINLWGNDLEDISFISQLINLEIAQLASNKINTLKDVVKCSQLKDLNLRNNVISNIEELQLLKLLPNLKALNLLYNPVTQNHNYRYQVLKHAPQLEILDEIAISQQERRQVQQEEEKENQIKQKVLKNHQKIKKIESKISIKKSQDKKQKSIVDKDFVQKLSQQQEVNKKLQEIDQFFNDQSQELQDSFIQDSQEINFSNENKNMQMLVGDRASSQSQINNKIQEEEIPIQIQKSDQIIKAMQPKQNSKKKSSSKRKEDQGNSSQILCAILSLLEVLKKKEISFLRRKVEKKIKKYKS
ncbi:unnamed protein product (macronuclear) [Paramecium tetraurelia]|uniref:U2A'/phosphoprotein 32 family A C-terminal domain-containing protein n=1 Tax=Paramecium tetraurelia TaxID=5888 RepID=A0D704_PARTE|nr:uncharacterized protein GSPATT00001862001 [Paramecium tetraurelia]CAK78821.1 unnamed protein product [Paramecium tetraurelia]|eukprot:XP_001446218.1 hypothetical protein (macronuclear) [Paramecium tetraurelia strain d4-2]